MRTIGRFIGVLLCWVSLCAYAGTQDAQWKLVRESLEKGLPQTAISNLQGIATVALRDKAYPEAAKAIGQRIHLESQIQGNKPEERITRLEAEIARAPKELTPILETLLAHWYWDYFQQNSWRFMNRTATAQAPGKDFTTWDLPRLFAEIDRHFRLALAAEATLKKTPISAWDGLLAPGTIPDAYRPTLYDFVAHEALAFYTSGEQAATKSEDAFEIVADSPCFDTPEAFLAWTPRPASKPGDTNTPVSNLHRAIELYQALLRFHAKDAPPALALGNADLERLTWANNVAAGDNKAARYEQALAALAERNRDSQLYCMALRDLANHCKSQGNLARAHELALRGAQAFPDSPGATLCRNILKEIELPQVTLRTERVWNRFTNSAATAPGAEIALRYRNLDAVYFRAIPFNWETFLQRRYPRPENLRPKEQKEVLSVTPALTWSSKLAPTTDFQEHTVQLPAPATLKPGFYFIAASHNPEFSETNNQVSLADVWVTDLALITAERADRLEGFVLDANSGEPLSGATVNVWHLDRQGDRAADPNLTTDENGRFSMGSTKEQSYLLRASYQGRELAIPNELWRYRYQQADEETKPLGMTVFFTDRAIYRPGQTIQYKGISLWVDQAKDNYTVLKGEDVTVIFSDSNGKEISRQKRRANDYGSFSGSFTAPRDRLMGSMSLHIEGRAQGSASVQVEEYKRPKFEVTLDAPKTAPRLNEKVSLTGHAMGYTGAAIDGADVRYRVVREVHMPVWWRWWGGFHPSHESQEIAHGNLRTQTDGSFQIEFIAVPDRTVAETNEPTFSYEVHADVTDAAGETRSEDKTVRVGYAALETTLTAADWQTQDQPVEFKLTTKTLDDEPQPATGTLKLYSLVPPGSVQRAELSEPLFPRYGRGYMNPFGRAELYTNLSDPQHWPLGPVVAELAVATTTNGPATVTNPLPAGAYCAEFQARDRFGKAVTSRQTILVLQPSATQLAIKVPSLVSAPEWKSQPGAQFTALWGTGYESGRAFIQIEHRGKIIQSYWTKPGQTQQQIPVTVTESMRGGFTLHVTQVRDNRAYLKSQKVEVPWSNKDLALKWEHFTSKLQPNQKETWSLIIRPADTNAQSAERLAAELVAALYDESLDAFTEHAWQNAFNCFYEDTSSFTWTFANTAKPLTPIYRGWRYSSDWLSLTYRSFPPELVEGYVHYSFGDGMARTRGFSTASAGVPIPPMAAAPAPVAMMAAPKAAFEISDRLNIPQGGRLAKANMTLGGAAGAEDETPHASKPDLSQVSARKNLNETAFFFPQLTSDSNGLVRLAFTMPEALTKWHFRGFAHDQSLRAGLLEGHVVTAKDLMVQPNPPRFLREGDTVEFTVKVSNQSDAPQTGLVRLSFKDALTDTSLDAALALSPALSSATANQDQSFSIPAKESRTFYWRLSVPDGCGFLTYKAVASSSTVSDGEEGALPVLARRILVTESLPLPIRGPGTRKFEFTKLLQSGSSKTLQHQSLTAQMVSHPAWHAVLALPYLMEYPHECAEQTFNRLYANALARTIANRDPRIRRVFDLWKNTPALDSPLEKNQELKSVAIEETPWLRQAQNESQARKNLGILFDRNRLDSETESCLRKLADLQHSDGAWPWFPGGPRNDYITLYITTGFGRLRHLGADVDISPALRSLDRLDQWMDERYEDLHTKNSHPEQYVPGCTEALYLYGRSFFLKDRPIPSEHRKTIDYFLAQARKFWLQTGSRQTQAHLALALQRFSSSANTNDPTPKAIVASLKERSVTNEEMGRFWRDTEFSWWWYRAPIETQALMIEAFDEITSDQAAVEDCRVWLLKQKQTQDWKTTKATADAIYALLLRGAVLLGSDELVRLSLGGLDVTPKTNASAAKSKPVAKSPPEPGTGFYEVRFAPADIKAKLGQITVTKTDPGIAWGSVHWQYLEDIGKITPHEGTPLKLSKALFVKSNTSHGPVLEAVRGPIKVGDELVVRLELRVDRDMEYVHLKDYRGSGTEPVNVLSHYKYKDGLAYYESTRDTASHFFIDYLPKGAHVFEYSTRVQLRGRYQAGLAEIQCLYAPEFNSHSASQELEVR
jgi:hypothetical protein